MTKKVETIRTGLRKFNRWARVLSPDPYELGLSLSQSGALVDLQRFGDLRPANLAKLLKLDRSSVSRLIARLAGDKLITIENSDRDGRGKILRLAPKGITALEKINQKSNESVLKVFEFLSSSDQEAISKAFEKLAIAVEKAEEKYGNIGMDHDLRG
jgi:DNA-binding MarR family transcriptional regulator